MFLISLFDVFFWFFVMVVSTAAVLAAEFACRNDHAVVLLTDALCEEELIEVVDDLSIAVDVAGPLLLTMGGRTKFATGSDKVELLAPTEEIESDKAAVDNRING